MPKDLHRSRSLLLWYKSRGGRRTSPPGSQVIETTNKRRQLHDLIPALHTALARSGLGNPGAHCKNGTADTISPRTRTAHGATQRGRALSLGGGSYVKVTSIDESGMMRFSRQLVGILRNGRSLYSLIGPVLFRVVLIDEKIVRPVHG